MDISSPVRISVKSDDGAKKPFVTKNFVNFSIFLPIVFFRSMFGYLYTRGGQIMRFSSATYEVLAVSIDKIKDWMVSRMFWGRGDLYKFFFRGGLLCAVMAWFYLSFFWEGTYAGVYSADTAFVVQQKDFEVELGSSSPPIDKDRPRDTVWEYIVQGGDTLSTIADKFSISVDTIKWSNGLSSDYIRPGQTLKILPVTGVLHKVKSGDSLASVAEKYKASEQAIADVNWLDPPFNLQEGQELMVPGGEIEAPRPQPAPVVTVSAPSLPAPSTGSGAFIMPTTGYISQYYWTWHRAIDIASSGAPDVVAADSGTVVYSGWDSTGYGLTILIDHGNGFVTRYAHSSSLYVKTGQYVNRGQAIMRMGSTGRSTGTHLHFEIILNGVKQNPMAYL